MVFVLFSWLSIVINFKGNNLEQIFKGTQQPSKFVTIKSHLILPLKLDLLHFKQEIWQVLYLLGRFLFYFIF